jgi:hypothetical protein
MKRLGIELTSKGQIPTHVVHCDAFGTPCSGGRIVWLSTLKGYALKLNPTIDDIQRQPSDEMKAIEGALDQQFDYLLLVYKFVKD